MSGQWIKTQRQARGWTHAQLAEVRGISRAYLQQLEINRRPLLNISTQRISRTYS